MPAVSLLVRQLIVRAANFNHVLRSVLAEFCNDSEAVGRDHVINDWPDLSVTYDRAKAVLQNAQWRSASGVAERTGGTPSWGSSIAQDQVRIERWRLGDITVVKHTPLRRVGQLHQPRALCKTKSE